MQCYLCYLEILSNIHLSIVKSGRSLHHMLIKDYLGTCATKFIPLISQEKFPSDKTSGNFSFSFYTNKFILDLSLAASIVATPPISTPSINSSLVIPITSIDI